MHQGEQRRKGAASLHQELAKFLLEKVAAVKRFCADQIIEVRESVARQIAEEKSTLGEMVKHRLGEQEEQSRQQLLSEARNVAARADEAEVRLQDKLEQMTKVLRSEAGGIEERIKMRLREVQDKIAQERGREVERLQLDVSRRLEVCHLSRRSCFSGCAVLFLTAQRLEAD